MKIPDILDPRRMFAGEAAGDAPKPGAANGARKTVNLALQGGGAHGAFTWGVIDQLLDDGRLGIEGVSGTSAGAMNAVILAYGLGHGGPEDARKRLAEFWRAASLGGNLPPLQRAVVERLFSYLPSGGSPMTQWMQAFARYLSPYQFNPLNINPLKDLIESFVDFKALRAMDGLSVFISATNVQSGRVRVFPRDKITADVVMASACLPMLFQAVEIDGVPYWDGGYVGNPVLFPFFHATHTEDVLVVQINPLERRGVPKSSQEIMGRVNEITFNASLIAEMRAINFVAKLIDQGKLPRGTGEGEYRRINVHRIVLEGSAKKLNAASRLNNDYEFFQMLHTNGKRAARRFLDAHFDDVGVRSSVDLSAEVKAERG
jgi:NTE family protein